MDGIKSGAFWFYYKFGFRPIDKSLKTLSTKEDKKIKSGNGYRSAEKTLIQLSESDMALQLSVPRHPSVSVFSARVQESIIKKFVGNRNDAIAFVWTKYPKLYALTKKDKQLALAAMELGMLALFGLKKKAISEELLCELCLLRDKDYVAYNRQLAICINA
ncbi:hypothetical protein, partial [Umezakia ovalisporum]|uniref:hypothetical protein n=1 Tax=Umezakia ovalisporum TaxID=75695 RepID=UPI0039C5ECB9